MSLVGSSSFVLSFVVVLAMAIFFTAFSETSEKYSLPDLLWTAMAMMGWLTCALVWLVVSPIYAISFIFWGLGFIYLIFTADIVVNFLKKSSDWRNRGI